MADPIETNARVTPAEINAIRRMAMELLRMGPAAIDCLLCTLALSQAAREGRGGLHLSKALRTVDAETLADVEGVDVAAATCTGPSAAAFAAAVEAFGRAQFGHGPVTPDAAPGSYEDINDLMNRTAGWPREAMVTVGALLLYAAMGDMQGSLIDGLVPADPKSGRPEIYAMAGCGSGAMALKKGAADVVGKLASYAVCDFAVGETPLLHAAAERDPHAAESAAKCPKCGHPAGVHSFGECLVRNCNCKA